LPPATHGCVLLGGDIDTLMGSTWIWSGTSWSQRMPASAPDSRTWAAAATLDGNVVVFGGYAALPDGSGYVNDTWVWDGENWTEQHPAESPSARYGAAVATLNDQVVLFGGLTPGTALNDTWVWDGSNWTEQHPATSPPGRNDAAAATVNGKIVLFGGVVGISTGSTLANDTWEWDGKNWTELHPPTSPSARDAPMAATVGSTMVLFGGRREGNPTWNYLNDTWGWDGSTWTELAPALSPPPRIYGAVGALNGTLVLFGGFGGAELGDTWVWTGSTWMQELGPGPGASEAESQMSCY
jgi:N-acetylneuraminic acid mutarotase